MDKKASCIHSFIQAAYPRCNTAFFLQTKKNLHAFTKLCHIKPGSFSHALVSTTDRYFNVQGCIQKLALQYDVLHPSVCFYLQFPPCTSILHLLCYTTIVLQYIVFIKSTITLKFIQNKENLDLKFRFNYLKNDKCQSTFLFLCSLFICV